MSRMSVSELSRFARTPVSTIKFYLREGLLTSGDLEAEHRAYYDDAHVQRLRLIQVLRDVGGLPIPAIRDICRLLDGEGSHDWARVIAHVIDALGRRESPAGDDVAEARRDVLELLAAKGIRVRRNARAVSDLADALAGLRRTFAAPVPAQALTPYLDAMCALAEQDFALNKHLVTSAATAAVGATYATVLWEPVLLLLRRIAHEHVAARVFAHRPGKRR